MTVLESDRMIFRPHQLSDMDAYCEMEADAEVRRFVGGAPRTREAAERKFQDVHLRRADAQLGLSATFFKPEMRYIGYCGLYRSIVDGGEIAEEAVLGFTLARAYWGRGLATEAALTFVRFGFGDLALRSIVSVVEVGNTASVRVLEKLGFALTETETGVRSFHKLELKKPDFLASADGGK
jgi:[ribosomal protein S5]-alanine N-acetyltransferase